MSFQLPRQVVWEEIKSKEDVTLVTSVMGRALWKIEHDTVYARSPKFGVTVRQMIDLARALSSLESEEGGDALWFHRVSVMGRGQIQEKLLEVTLEGLG